MTATLPPGFSRAGDGRLAPPRLFAEAGRDEQFWADGFFKTPLLDDRESAELAERFGQLRPADGFDPTSLTDARCSYHCTFLDPDRSYRRAVDELVRGVFEQKLRAVVPGYQILTSNIYVKPAGAGRFEIHQNWPTIQDLDVPTMTAWVPLQDTGFENGTIRLVRGSHHLFPDVAAASSDRFFDDFERDLIETYLEPIDVRRGELLVFDDSLLHWSGANISATPRVTFQIELIPDGVPAALWIRNAADPSMFDLWAIDKEYWIEYPFESVLGATEGLELLDRCRNPNERISLAEFEKAMEHRDEIRRSKFAFG